MFSYDEKEGSATMIIIETADLPTYSLLRTLFGELLGMRGWAWVVLLP